MKAWKSLARRSRKTVRRTKKVSSVWLVFQEVAHETLAVLVVIIGVWMSYAVTRTELRFAVLSEIGSNFISVATIFSAAVVFLRERKVRKHDLVQLLKAKHKRFFEIVSDDVAQLIEKSQKNARSFPRSSK